MRYIAITLDEKGEKGYSLVWVSDDGAVWSSRHDTSMDLLNKIKNLIDEGV